MIKANLILFNLLLISFSAIIQSPTPSTNGTQPNSTKEEIVLGRSVYTPTDNLQFQDVFQPFKTSSIPTNSQPTQTPVLNTSSINYITQTNTTSAASNQLVILSNPILSTVTIQNSTKPANQTSSTNSTISAQPVILTNTSTSVNPTITVNVTQNSTNRSIEGSYQLKLPTQSFRIRNNSIILTMCNTHIFTISVTKVTVGTSTVASVRIFLSSSTKLVCQQNYDSYYTSLLTKVTLYELKENQIIFYKSSGVIASAKRNLYMTLPSTKIDGRWELQVPSLPLRISKTLFEFEGCSKNSLGYTLTPATKQISLKSLSSTLKSCNINNDGIFIDALTKSNFYQIRETSFILYSKNGEGSAYGTRNI